MHYQVKGDEARTVIKQCRGKATARFGPFAFYIKDEKVAITTVLSDCSPLKRPTDEQVENLQRLLPELKTLPEV